MITNGGNPNGQRLLSVVKVKSEYNEDSIKLFKLTGDSSTLITSNYSFEDTSYMEVPGYAYIFQQDITNDLSTYENSDYQIEVVINGEKVSKIIHVGEWNTETITSPIMDSTILEGENVTITWDASSFNKVILSLYTDNYTEVKSVYLENTGSYTFESSLFENGKYAVMASMINTNENIGYICYA